MIFCVIAFMALVGAFACAVLMLAGAVFMATALHAGFSAFMALALVLVMAGAAVFMAMARAPAHCPTDG